MKQIFSSLLIVCTVLSAGNLRAQEEGQGDVVIHTDVRLAVLLKKSTSYARLSAPEAAKPGEATKPAATISPTSAALMHREMKVIYSGKGFRVQIYNGPDRKKALSIKTEFMRRFPGVSSYLVYISPAFRVKIGDYRSRSEAERMLREANAVYKPSMIVPDIVTVTTY